MLKDRTIGFIGGGNMGEALIRGLLAAQAVPAGNIIVSDVVPERLRHLKETYHVGTTPDNQGLVSESDVVVLAIKPQVMEEVLSALGEEVTEEKLLVSIMAGVPMARILGALGREARLVRVMPNTPALALAGAAAYALGGLARPEDSETVRDIFEAVGTAFEVEEKLLDAVTGLSGSGPAYVLAFIEALADGGVWAGLDRDTAFGLAVQTVLGTAVLLAESNQHPAELREMVTSPGGTTIEALSVLEAGGFKGLVMDAVFAAAKRAEALGKG